MSPPSRFGAFVILVVIAVSGGTSLSQATSPLRSVSSDPYTNPVGRHMTEVEPHAFAVGNTVVSAFQVGRFSEAGSSGIGWARSIDGGSTWSKGFLPSLTADEGGGPYASASDPAVGYDAKHATWFISSLGNYGSPTSGHFLGSDVVASRSTDGGATWQRPVVVGFGGRPTILDKPWVVCDNTATSSYYGNCYMTWDHDADGAVYMSASSDGGSTWSVPSQPAGGATGLGGVPQVMLSGRVVVPMLTTSNTIGVFDSADGGATWGKVRDITDVSFHDVSGRVRTDPLPASAVDGGGTAFVAWSDCRFSAGCSRNDIVFTQSSDGGGTWSAVKRIPVDLRRGDHWGIGLGVDPKTSGRNAHLAVSYYVNRTTACKSPCQVDIRYTSSVDGGAHWSAATQLAGPMQQTWAPFTDDGRMFGDYFGMAIVSDGSAVPAVSVALRSGRDLDQSIWSGRLAVPGPKKPARASAGSEMFVHSWGGGSVFRR